MVLATLYNYGYEAPQIDSQKMLVIIWARVKALKPKAFLLPTGALVYTLGCGLGFRVSRFL